MYHNKRDSKGRFSGSGLAAKLPKPRKRVAIGLTNHVALVLDRSGSVYGIRNEIVDQFNKQIETLRTESRRTNIKTFVTVYTFSTTVDKPLYVKVDVEIIPRMEYHQFSPAGGTALRDGICDAIGTIRQDMNTKDRSVSYLVVTITDGQENESKRYTANDFKGVIGELTATDLWTFAFLCPQYDVKHVEALGIPRGNIQPWEATSYGTQVMSGHTISATQDYYSARNLGATMSTSYFKPDLDNVTGTALQKQLDDVSQDFLRLNVTETGRIDEFVAKTTGNSYKIGSGLYQLTKQEFVQDYKKIVVQNKTSNKLHSGVAVCRQLLNLPLRGTIRLRPSLHKEYVIFVQSTASNRKLIGGTTLLLDKSLI